MEVPLGSEDFGAEEERFGQPGHGAAASAELLEHGQHETTLLGFSHSLRN